MTRVFKGLLTIYKKLPESLVGKYVAQDFLGRLREQWKIWKGSPVFPDGMF